MPVFRVSAGSKHKIQPSLSAQVRPSLPRHDDAFAEPAYHHAAPKFYLELALPHHRGFVFVGGIGKAPTLRRSVSTLVEQGKSFVETDFLHIPTSRPPLS
jgi:hypothetical protein